MITPPIRRRPSFERLATLRAKYSFPLSSTAGGRAGVSVAEATLTIAKTCIGGGILALPYAHLQGGVLAVPSMCLLGLWNWITSQQLLEAYEALPTSEARASRTGYSAVAHAALGASGVLLLDVSVCLLLTGVCASMQVSAAHLVEEIVPRMALPFGDSYSVLVLLSGGCLVPLALLRDLSRLAVVAGVGLSVITFGLLVVAASGVARFGMPSPPQQMLELPDLSGVASFFSIAAFSFGMQTNLLPVRDGMAEPTRAPEALTLAVIVVVGANTAVGVGLAWLYAGGGEDVEQLILLNLPPSSLPAYLVQASTAAVAILGYPLPMMPVMQLLPARLPPALRTEGSDGRGAVAGAGARVGFLAITTALALALREFAVVASLCGILAIFVCLVLPPLCHLRLCSCPPSHDDDGVDGSLTSNNGRVRAGVYVPTRRADGRLDWLRRNSSLTQGAHSLTGASWRPMSALVDAALVAVGVGALAYFTAAALRSMGSSSPELDDTVGDVSNRDVSSGEFVMAGG
jgi:amino acid permease